MTITKAKVDALIKLLEAEQAEEALTLLRKLTAPPPPKIAKRKPWTPGKSGVPSCWRRESHNRLEVIADCERWEERVSDLLKQPDVVIKDRMCDFEPSTHKRAEEVLKRIPAFRGEYA